MAPSVCRRLNIDTRALDRPPAAGEHVKGTRYVTIAQTVGYGGKKRRLRRACVCRADAPSVQLPLRDYTEHTCYTYSTNRYSFVITLPDST